MYRVNSTRHEEAIPQRPAGWLNAWPLEKFSSLHEVSMMGFLGWRIHWPATHFFIEYNSNLNTPLKLHPKACLIFDLRDAELAPSLPQFSFSINQLKRWRIYLNDYRSIESFIESLNNHQRHTYAKAERKFKSYGCEVSFIEDWSKYVETVYYLYSKVAQKHGENWLYDLHFFQEAAKRSEYKLLSAWFKGKMIGAFLLLDEAPTLHGFCCGLDYEHSTPSCTYSWMNYEFIQYAFQKHYQNVDVAITSDECKKSLGFTPVPTRLDVYSKGMITRCLFRAASLFFTATINSEGKLKFRSRLSKNA